MDLSRRSVVAFLLCALPRLAPAGPKVAVNYDRDFNFATLKSYQWRTHPVMEQNPELAQRAIAGEIVMSEGNEILMGRGYTPDDVEPDFYLAFFVKGNKAEEATVYTKSWYYGPTPYWAGATETIYRQFVEGTLVIDVVDAKSKRLVWRAHCQAKIDDWKDRHKDIAKAVKTAFKDFPPKPSK